MKRLVIYDSQFGNTEKIAQARANKGGHQIIVPEGFIVSGKEGPLVEGELQRAKNWLQI